MADAFNRLIGRVQDYKTQLETTQKQLMLSNEKLDQQNLMLEQEVARKTSGLSQAMMDLQQQKQELEVKQQSLREEIERRRHTEDALRGKQTELENIVDDLKQRQLAVEDQGALVVFLQELADKEGNPSAFIVQKTGGGFLYSTTDLAACQYRSHDLNADRVVIFTDARQALHFKQVELVARKAGYLRDATTYDHCPFGTMMGEDGKPFKTRTGGTVKLAELLEEAVVRAKAVVQDKASDLSDDEIAEVARKVGIGAVKFADLSKNRTSDYIFSWDAMLSFEGATAPYLQYAYTRVRSILRRADITDGFSAALVIEQEQEKQLAVKLLRFEEVLQQVMKDAQPNLLCNYLYELASLYMAFYEACPILKDGVEPAQRDSRLMLSIFTSKLLKQGLDLLGIEVMERM